MKKTLYSGIAAGALLAALALMAAYMLLAGAPKAHANPSGFYGRVTTPGTSTAPTASTSVSYMSSGVGTTTTQALDAYAGGNSMKVESAALNVQFTGSSTSAVLLVQIEASQDNKDWYPVTIMTGIGIATTTNDLTLNSRESYTLTAAATTTLAGLPVATSTGLVVGLMTPRMLIIPTQERYTRAVFSVTGANGGVWAEIVPVRQIHE